MTGGVSSATGGTNSGQSNTGGASTADSSTRGSGGSAATGGSSHASSTTGDTSTGLKPSTGGAATGGKSSTGGAAAGGKSSAGGAPTGGKSSNGTEFTGGNPSSGGGFTTGGVANGGASASGGAASGGGVTGGKSSTGGAASGGAATGGAGTGGANTGCAATGFHIQDGKVYDSKCNEFIMRGVNYPYAWYTTETQQRFADMASTKANSVRVVLSVSRWGTTSAPSIASILSHAKTNKMVAILEVHDCTGYGDDSAALNPDTCVQFWLKSDVVDVLEDTEAYAMINIANEAFGNETSGQWASFYQSAVPKFRSAGLKHTLIVDAPNWGQDWSNTMRDGTGATTIFGADPDKNVIFSTHMYDVYSSSSTITSYFSKFLEKGLPFIIGEFAADHGSKGNVDEATIMAQCEQLGIGYLGWSWSGNSSDLASLDITNDFDVSSLTTWGNTLINGSNGIKATAETCSALR